MSAGEERNLPWATQWRVFVDAATVAWLTLFILALTPWSPVDSTTGDRIGLLLLSVFVVDLGALYYRANLGVRAFLRRHWLSVLLVIPYFRVFRILRALRFLRFLRLAQHRVPPPLCVSRNSR